MSKIYSHSVMHTMAVSIYGGNEMKKFYIVPHSHLDREWYRTFQENRVKLIRFMDDLLDTMEQDPTYTFYSLDAQTSFIDDYFDVKPENRERFARLVKEGRLPIGPWYVQPDEHLPTAEGIIRNLLISKNISDQFADFNRVGYVPDSFGQSATYPTLMKGFGIDSAVLYRGLAEDDSKYNDFIWEGLDGSRLLANWMPIGYGNAMFLNEDDAHNLDVIQENIELLSERSVSENYLLMCGSDQSFIKKFLPETVRRLNALYKEKGMDYTFELATPQHYIDAIRPYTDQMEVVHGELRKGKRSRTHNSIGATRMDIKHRNFELEQKYLNVLEPLSALCERYGMPKDGQLINRGWKYIVENHAHDSICCCCTDAIHKELLMRMEYANQLADYVIKEKFEGLHEKIRYTKGMGRPIILFSAFLKVRSQQIDVDVYVKDSVFAIFNAQGEELAYDILSIERFNLKDTKVSFTPIPDDYYDKVNIRLCVSSQAYGYETVYIKEGVQPSRIAGSMIKDGELHNGLITLHPEKDGSFTITDLTADTVYKNQHVIYDDGNAGDEYDYSPSFHDFAVTSLHALKETKIIEDTPLRASIEYTFVMQVPQTTSNDKRSDTFTDIIIKTTASVRRNEKQIYFKTEIENTAKNHRIQVRFDSGRLLETNFANIQLGEIERKNVFAQTEESENGWHERYYPVFNQHAYSGLKDQEHNGFIIMNKGLPQYEIYQEATTQLAITLLSCVGNMGNTDLKYRPGRRSGSTDATPDSQMLGKFTCEYAFMPIHEDTDYTQTALSYVNEITAISYPEFSCDGYLPDSLELVSCDSGLYVSCLKSAEDQDGEILRIINPYPYALQDQNIQVNRHVFSSIETVNLAEEAISCEGVRVHKQNNPDGSAMAVMSGKVCVDTFVQNGILTLRLK